jgi:hypothetical protein
LLGRRIEPVSVGLALNHRVKWYHRITLRVNAVVGYVTYMPENPETTVRKLVSLPRDLVREVEDFRFEHRIKTESETIRVLIRRGLDADSKPKRKAT